MLTRDEILDFCYALLSAQFVDYLNEWEDKFVRSIQQQTQDGRPLTPRQDRILNDIMEVQAQRHGRT